MVIEQQKQGPVESDPVKSVSDGATNKLLEERFQAMKEYVSNLITPYPEKRFGPDTDKIEEVKKNEASPDSKDLPEIKNEWINSLNKGEIPEDLKKEMSSTNDFHGFVNKLNTKLEDNAKETGQKQRFHFAYHAEQYTPITKLPVPTPSRNPVTMFEKADLVDSEKVPKGDGSLRSLPSSLGQSPVGTVATIYHVPKEKPAATQSNELDIPPIDDVISSGKKSDSSLQKRFNAAQPGKQQTQEDIKEKGKRRAITPGGERTGPIDIQVEKSGPVEYPQGEKKNEIKKEWLSSLAKGKIPEDLQSEMLASKDLKGFVAKLNQALTKDAQDNNQKDAYQFQYKESKYYPHRPHNVPKGDPIISESAYLVDPNKAKSDIKSSEAMLALGGKPPGTTAFVTRRLDLQKGNK